jgi:hypothetical protein
LLQNLNDIRSAAEIMKTIIGFVLFSICLSVAAFAQTPATPAFNLVEGIGPVTSVGSWSGYSALSVLAGPSLLSKASKTTTFYVGFTAGTTAVLGDMVLYKTATRASKILTVTKVTLGGVSNPTIKISDKSVCPAQPVSVTNPCIVRLDPVTLALSAKDDYYLTMFFAPGTDISSTTAAFATTALSGWYIAADETQLKVGQSVPAGNGGHASYFLYAVMSN